MPDRELPLPPHFDAGTVGQVWRVPYQQRAAEAERWAAQHSLGPAGEDSFTLCLLAVDVQNTFCIPDFELYVGGRSGTGAVDDNQRLCEFIYRNLGAITTICPTLDTHQAPQIFHSIFLVNEAGEHPAPYSLISSEDIERGVWKFNAALAGGLGFDAGYVDRHLRHYSRVLSRTNKYALTIWPYHAMLGGIGHALVPAVEEAIFFHSLARRAQPNFQVKGDNPLTEHYSVLGPEVTDDGDGRSIAGKNEALINWLCGFDAVVIAGQAKSHCVAWTIQDLLEGLKTRDSSLANKVYLLEDCSSPVVVPGVIDYTDEAEAAFGRFAEAGMHIVRSTDPIATWPGMDS
jgi:nicotinamidase-related amidase